MKKIVLPLLLVIVMAIPPILPTQQTSVVRAQDDSTISIPGLQGEVVVVYDQMGIPHIYADSVEDLFMAQGYVEASHRWWQMEWWRHQSAGRLSEIAGPSLVGTDSFLRTLGFQEAARKDLEIADDETVRALEAYAAGVNAYLEATPVDELPVEYGFLAQAGFNVEIEPWTTLDTLRWLKVMSFSLSGNLNAEIERAFLRQANPIAPEVFFPRYDFEDFPAIVEPGGVQYADNSMMAAPDLSPFEGASINLVGGVDLSDPNITPFGYGVDIGSNSWVIGGDLTDSGTPYLANDPHLGIQAPSIWYEVGLHCNTVSEECPYNVVGVTFAGVPGIIIGHNDRIAWGFTNVGTDVQDLYMLQVNPDNPGQYMLDGEWTDFEIIEETIVVNGGEPVTLPVRMSVWGPVVSEVLGLPQNMVLALRWTALDANTSVTALLALNRAQNWEEFRGALSLFDVPAQNIVYADVDGNIGYQMPGNTPIRAEGHDPRVPVDGSTTDNAWQGFVPFDELPSIYNPEAGYIVTANNSVVGPDYPYYITADWDYGYRAARIEQMIQNDPDGVITVDDMMAMQNDNYNLKADFLIPALESLNLEGPLGDDVAWLAEWDRQNDIDSGQALLFEAFWIELLDLLFRDDLGSIPTLNSRSWYIVSEMLENRDNPIYIGLIDNAGTEEVETLDMMLETALERAVTRVEDLQGPDRSVWAWGNVHVASFRAAPLGQGGIDPQFDPILNSLFNTQIGVPGGTAIVNAISANTQFEVGGLVSFRQILIPADWDSSLRINTLGQSGDPQSRHYRDQVEMWAAGEYHPDWFSRDAVEADVSVTWVLVPAE